MPNANDNAGGNECDAPDAPASTLARLAAAIPAVLASRAHQLLLLALGAWLIGVPLALPFIGWAQPSARAELIGGNWTNVSSALGACIAAGAGIRSLHEHRRHRLAEEARRETAEATHELLLRLHTRLAAAENQTRTAASKNGTADQAGHDAPTAT